MTTVKTTRTFRLFVVAALFVVAFGCNPAPDTGAEYPDETDETATLLTPQERAERREALSRQWQDARDRLEELRQKANSDGLQNEWDEAVAKIDREASDLRRELDEFEEDSRQAWNSFEARVERSIDSIGREIDEAVEHFN
jgi:exonuclease VII large subunit